MSTSEYPAERLSEPRLPRLRSAVGARAISSDVLVLGALIVIAAAIRILVINNQSFWTDEALTAYEAHLPFGAMINTVAHVETTPPLYFVVAWAWAHVFGTGEVALRSISTIAGIALVPIAYLAGRELFSRWAGVIAAAFVALNPFMVWYSQEARAYMLLALLTGASFLWFIRARNDPTRRNLAWWAIFSSLAVMTHFFAGFLVAPEAMWLLWNARGARTTRVFSRRTRGRRGVWIAVGIVAAFQAAMLPLAFVDTDTAHQAGWIAAVPRVLRISSAVAEWGVSLLYRRLSSNTEAFVGGAVVVAVVLLLLALSRDRVTLQGVKVAGAIVCFVLLAPLALALVGQDYFLSRNEIPAFVPLAVLIAAVCVAPRVRVLGAAFAVALLAMFIYSGIKVQTNLAFQRPAWRNAARALGPATVPRAILSTGGTSADPLKIYLPGVDWTESHSHRVWIREVDVVGLLKAQPLALSNHAVRRTMKDVYTSPNPPTLWGSPVPRSKAPHGARLIARFRLHQWMVARFALRRPMLVSIDQLVNTASRYFRRTPQGLLVFFQPRTR